MYRLSHSLPVLLFIGILHAVLDMRSKSCNTATIQVQAIVHTELLNIKGVTSPAISTVQILLSMSRGWEYPNIVYILRQITIITGTLCPQIRNMRFDDTLGAVLLGAFFACMFVLPHTHLLIYS